MKKPVYDSGLPLKLDELSPEQLAYLQESGMGKISTDPRYKDAQLEALRSMEERSKNGMTAADEADMYKLQRNVSTQNRGRMGAIQNNMAVRGMSGSGMDALMQMQSNQDATDREALAAMEKAGQIQNNKMNASQQLGQMGSQMRGQEFGEKSAKAQAADEIARFNAQTRNGALNQNNQTRNQANTQNWGRGNQVNDQNVTMGYNYDVENENRKLLRDQENRRRKGAVTGAILGAGGAVAGGYFSGGNPAAIGAGYGAGSALGSNIQGYAYGGLVEDIDINSQNVPMPDYLKTTPNQNLQLPVNPAIDNPKNDTVPALLSPGEAVIPKSAMSSEEMFKQYTDRLKESIKERQGKVSDAEGNVKNAQYGSILSGMINDFSKGNRKDVVLHNNIQNLGGKPVVSQGEYNSIKDTWTEPAQAELARQDKGLLQDKADFNQSEGMRNHFDDKQRKGVEQGQRDWQFSQEQDKAKLTSDLLARESDPNSSESKLAQSLASKMAPNFDFTTMSASQINERLPSLSGIYKIEQDKLARKDNLSNRTYENELKKIEKDKITYEKKKATLDEVEDRRKNIEDNLNLLEQQIKNKGTYEIFGSHNADLERRVENIATDMAKLSDPNSVARPSEVESFKKGLIKANMASMTNDTALTILKNFRSEVNSRAENAYRIRGVENPNKPSQANPQANDTINNLQLPGNWKEHK
jgi:hypothetical protein